MMPNKWIVAAGGVVALMLAAWGWSAQQQRIGALRYAVADDVLVAKTARARGDSLGRVFRTDTIRTFRNIRRVDSILTTVVRADTLRLTDTVKVTVEVVREAVATLNACRATVLTCGQLNEQRAAEIAALNAQVKKMQALQPSLLSRCGISAGYGTTDKGFGPAILAGCRIAP